MSPEANRRQLRMTKDLGLNAIRLEGKLQDDDLFAAADELGILVLPCASRAPTRGLAILLVDMT